MNAPRTLLTVCLIATAAIAGCADSKDDAGGASPTPSGPAMNQTVPKIVSLSVTAQDTPPAPAAGTSPKFYGWTPATLTAKLNDTIDIRLKGVATNQLNHNLVITEFNVKITSVKESTTGKNATFVASKTGTFAYFCDIGTGPNSHRNLGMSGMLTVS